MLGFSEFFEDSFNTFIHFMMDDLSAPNHTMLSVQQFLTKNSMTSMPHPPYFPNLSPSGFLFVSLDERSPQRETFCQCRRGDMKNSKNIKRHRNRQVQKLEQWKNVSVGVVHQMESTLKVTEI